jgi:hypothetical protein
VTFLRFLCRLVRSPRQVAARWRWVYREWRKGCSLTVGRFPGDCPECSGAAFRALFRDD